MDYVFINVFLPLLAVIITLMAQFFISASYGKYKKIANSLQITGAETARKILDENGLYNVSVESVNGELSDHYDPRTKVVRLSNKIYNEPSIAAVSVAAHECGHAIQDRDGYLFMRIRAAIIPIVNFASYAGYFAILIGVIASSLSLIEIGIVMELVILLFQFITLPVEINASRRAMKQVKDLGILQQSEISGGKRMLTAAAMTYIASFVTTLLEILRLVLAFLPRDRDE